MPKPGALQVAKKALRLAVQATNATVETKYLSYNAAADVFSGAAGGSFGGPAVSQMMVNAGHTPLFNSGQLSGNKSFLKYIKGTWEIHMDNVNSEEETVNFTVAVVKPRADGVDNISNSAHVSTIQGQTYYDPRVWKILYYKHFTLTMGGVSPGTAGESRKFGRFYIPVNKMIRWFAEAPTGTTRAAGTPASNQDYIYFFVHTDNSAVDVENPRINYRFMSVYKDNDLQG